MNNKSRLSEIIVTKRLQLGMSQRELSAKSGVSQTTISFIETNRWKRTFPSTLRKIAVALEMDPAYLIGFAVEKRKKGKSK